jgi:hypothetical protein
MILFINYLLIISFQLLTPFPRLLIPESIPRDPMLTQGAPGIKPLADGLAQFTALLPRSLLTPIS